VHLETDVGAGVRVSAESTIDADVRRGDLAGRAGGGGGGRTSGTSRRRAPAAVPAAGGRGGGGGPASGGGVAPATGPPPPAATAGARPARPKRIRTTFKCHELQLMKTYFELNHNPDNNDLKQLSLKTGLSKRVLQASFSHDGMVT